MVMFSTVSYFNGDYLTSFVLNALFFFFSLCAFEFLFLNIANVDPTWPNRLGW